MGLTTTIDVFLFLGGPAFELDNGLSGNPITGLVRSISGEPDATKRDAPSGSEGNAEFER
jgi:hypothetical protein